MMKRRTVLVLMMVVFFLFPVITSERLLAAPYYEGKRITMVIGSETGGGYDRMARLLARFLPKHIPGKPTVIVENMAGASGMIAANHLYNIAKPDGLTIGGFATGLIIPQLLKDDGVRFDMVKYAWIGSSSAEASILSFRTDLPFKSFDDVRKSKEPIAIATTGVGFQNYQFPILLKEFVGVNFKMVFYPSTSAGMLAVERKEADGMATFLNSGRPFIARGLIKPLVRGRISEPEIENLPVDEDLATSQMGKTIMAIRTVPDQIARAYMAPPGTPAEIMNILRDAFSKLPKDSEVREEAKKMMLGIDYLPPDECVKALNYILKQPEDVVKELSKYIKF